MIVDFHTHIFPEKIVQKAMAGLSSVSHLAPVLDGTENELIESMKKSDSETERGCDLSIVLPVGTNALKIDSLNEFAMKINAKYFPEGFDEFLKSERSVLGQASDSKSGQEICGNPEKRLLSFAAIHPNCPELRNLVKEIAAQGFKGIKLHPDYQGVYFDDKQYYTIIEEAENQNLITVTHAGLDYGFLSEVHCSPSRALRLISDIKPKKLVLAHLGGNSLWYDVENMLCGLGVYFDTSFINTRITAEQFVRIIEKNGADKILFATDSPWDDVRADIDFVKSLPIGEEEKRKILGENAVKLLGW